MKSMKMKGCKSRISKEGRKMNTMVLRLDKTHTLFMTLVLLAEYQIKEFTNHIALKTKRTSKQLLMKLNLAPQAFSTTKQSIS